MKMQVQNNASEKETTQDGVDEMNWEVDSKDVVKHIERT